MSGKRVDVLAVMDADIRTFEVLLSMPELGISDPNNALCRSKAARAAVSELIAADRAFDLSRAALTEVSNRITAGSRSDDDFREQVNAQHAYDRAVDRRRAALSRIQPDGQGE